MVDIGDIFVNTWGYDQTNVDFVRVVGFTPSKKSAICQMMSKKIVEQKTEMSENVVPNDVHGSEFKLRIDGEHLRGSYPYVEGHKMYGSFWKWDGKPEHQSDWH